jgi:hypothetical protein
MLDEILKRVGLKYEDLTSLEKNTLDTWMESLEKSQLTIEKIKEYISSMKDAVEQELSKSTLDTKQDIFLKARMRNYMLLDGFLTSPSKAKQQIENAISSIIGKK